MPEETNPQKLTEEVTQKIANLSRLELTEEELKKFSHQLAAILQYAEDMDKLDLENIPPTSHPYPLKNVLREDELLEELSNREEVLGSAPSQEDNQFRVPPILGEPG